ncbi:unnamed protein product, partial [Adineta ricciae]
LTIITSLSIVALIQLRTILRLVDILHALDSYRFPRHLENFNDYNDLHENYGSTDMAY